MFEYDNHYHSHVHVLGGMLSSCKSVGFESITDKYLQLQNPSFADWRSHVNGMKRIVDLRGGPKKLMKEAPHLVPSLVLYLLYVAL